MVDDESSPNPKKRPGTRDATQRKSIVPGKNTSRLDDFAIPEDDEDDDSVFAFMPSMLLQLTTQLDLHAI